MHRYGKTKCATNLDAYPREKKHAGTDKVEYIFHKYKLKEIKATYAIAVCDIRPQNIDTHRKRIIAGGNFIDYPGDFSTPTSDLTTMKMMRKGRQNSQMTLSLFRWRKF